MNCICQNCTVTAESECYLVFYGYICKFYCSVQNPNRFSLGKLPQSNWDAHWATMVAPFAQLLLLLLLPAFGQPELPSPDGACDPGFLCRNERHCAAFLDLKAQLDRLSDASERDKLIRELRGKVCNKAEMGVCCKENLEVINGNVVNNIADLPFIVRLTIKTSSWPYSSSICGASLIHSQFLLTAKHCLMGCL